ncbi:Putative methyltransferase spot-1 [Caenorhabditis elegans]|uniref:Putative methyltransferase spot-1 n=1 Tax=Caenorhabditis elegans TaxID=6239 RepID=YMP6_CAEEL|nr:Putative methyltransferase B0361.6 [Caenorhabditis elegans]Q10950.1 RecName: Full=Putative methyltransferase B0361.6 [Caenorhabditis elegans]CCD61821.1 Putative methyltransferase B0361.6 [Caenorhabditis elegans]|eukprot:NP_498602.1 Putative methyltransferase B0361.6 [Caenorhabditis elegans]
MHPDQKKTFKEKNDIRKKLFNSTKEERLDWRKMKDEKKRKNEEKIIKEAEEAKKAKIEKVDHTPPFTISIAVPGQFLNNAQSAELRTYMAGQIARAATLYRVDEIIIYDESCRMTDEAVNAYYNGTWQGNLIPAETNYEGCFYLAKILEYLECPQYLRKDLFPIQKPLKNAGLLNPLDAQHHLKYDEKTLRFREGVVLKKRSKDGRGPICNIGLEKEFEIDSDAVQLPPYTRVTVEIKNLTEQCKLYRGSITSGATVTRETGLYWGYSVRLMTGLQKVLQAKKFDIVAGVSPRGKLASQMDVCILNKPKILLVFGGVAGVDAAVESEELAEWRRAEDAFDVLIRTTSLSNGSRSERVEENVLSVLAQVQCHLETLNAL